ncbi:MAG: hypothetical protein WDZ27_00460 [Waddliaceae bacterium]
MKDRYAALQVLARSSLSTRSSHEVNPMGDATLINVNAIEARVKEVTVSARDSRNRLLEAINVTTFAPILHMVLLWPSLHSNTLSTCLPNAPYSAISSSL